MAYTFGFADNAIYGADDINAVAGRLVTGGVADVFYNGTSYNTSDLNAITNHIATYGVRSAAGNALKVVKHSGTSVKVLSGGAFMNDGAYVEADADGVILEYVKGQENYVYIQNNLASSNTIDFVCSITEGTGDIVPLARISESGSITDTRVFCRGKLAGYQSESNQTKIIDVPYSIEANDSGKSQVVRVDLEGLGYSKVVNITSVLSKGYGAALGYCDLESNVYYSPCEEFKDVYDVLDDKLRIYSSHTSKGDDIVNAVFRLEGSVLVCTFTAYYGKSKNSTDTYVFNGNAKLLVC